ncbi:MAG: ATP-binding protein [Vicinamibacterales bacterium]
MSSRWTDRFRQTIGLRLAAWYLGTFLASTVVIGVIIYTLLAQSLEARDRDLIQSTLREYAARYQSGGFAALASAVELERRSGLREPLFVRLVGPFEDVLLYSLPEAWGAFDLSELQESGTNAVWRRVPAPGRNASLEVATLSLGSGTVLQVGKTTESRDQLLAGFRRVLLLAATAALAVGLAGGVLLTRSTLKPLRDLRDTVQRILQTGQTDDRVPVASTDDAVGELGLLFNAMLARITTLIHGMRNALDHVAHDLRTPMTRLRVTAESALSVDDPARHREALSDCLEESDRVLSMLTSLMDISEAETGIMRLVLTDVDVSSIVREVVGLYEDAADEAGVTLADSMGLGSSTNEVSPRGPARAHEPPSGEPTRPTSLRQGYGGPPKHLRWRKAEPQSLSVRADRDRLRQALANLVDNAVKYTPRGGRVDIEAVQEGPDVAIRVRDTGIGIPATDLPRIWDRLYRGDQSRATRGLGLGLSLVRASIEAQGGTVSVESTPGEGSTFTLRLPASTPGT